MLRVALSVVYYFVQCVIFCDVCYCIVLYCPVLHCSTLPLSIIPFAVNNNKIIIITVCA